MVGPFGCTRDPFVVFVMVKVSLTMFVTYTYVRGMELFVFGVLEVSAVVAFVVGGFRKLCYGVCSGFRWWSRNCFVGRVTFMASGVDTNNMRRTLIRVFGSVSCGGCGISL